MAPCQLVAGTGLGVGVGGVEAVGAGLGLVGVGVDVPPPPQPAAIVKEASTSIRRFIVSLRQSTREVATKRARGICSPPRAQVARRRPALGAFSILQTV
jgi:hypothetical protein